MSGRTRSQRSDWNLPDFEGLRLDAFRPRGWHDLGSSWTQMNATTHKEHELRHAFTRHAWKRMDARGLSADTIGRVLTWGRVAHVRGATIYAVGRKEIARLQRDGIDLSEAEGVQVVCTVDGLVMTAYRNQNFRGLRPRSRRAGRNRLCARHAAR